MRGAHTACPAQTETGCTIRVPSKESGEDVIVITGPTGAAVTSGLSRVELLIASALDGPTVPYTHFVSFKLSAPDVCAAVDAFKARAHSSVQGRSPHSH